VIGRRRKRPGRTGEILRRHEQVALGAEGLLVIVTALVVVAGARVILETDDAPARSTLDVALRAIAGVVVLLAMTIWLPRTLARLWSAPLLFATWPLWKAVYRLTMPLTIAARFVDTLLYRLAGRIPEQRTEETYGDEIRSVVTEGHREGLLEEEAREMIEGVIDLGDADVSEVMTPRTDMQSIQVGLPWQEVLDFVIKVRRTRIPVFDKNRDDVVGVLYAKDLLRHIAANSHPGCLPGQDPSKAETPDYPLATILRPAYFVPETKPLNDLLQEFQRTKNHMAVVLDEYGGVSGLVTIEDVLEEIVGEIADEYDDDLVQPIRRIDEHTAEVLARTHVDEINAALAIALPEDDDFDTIGGFVFSQLGRVPVVGERVDSAGVRITVLEATRRRIERVRIEILDRAQRESA
jgi:CBS domain containing-hemolysin-like protein